MSAKSLFMQLSDKEAEQVFALVRSAVLIDWGALAPVLQGAPPRLPQFGDKVRLKSGGPAMLVLGLVQPMLPDRIDPDGSVTELKAHALVICTWLDGVKVHSDSFLIACLDVVTA